MKINQNLTTANYNSGSGTGRVKYIVMHYTGNNGDTAYNNTAYFKSVNRGASAHYFVDESEIWQCVADKDIAWHVGNNTYIHPSCRNSNSIGVEMCSRKDSAGTYYFKDGTVANAVELVKMLMAKYNIPLANVIRHYDVTGKICPAPLVNATAWAAFKKKLEVEDMTKAETQALINSTVEPLKTQIAALNNEKTESAKKKCPEWAVPAVQYCIEKGYINGDGKAKAAPDNVRPMSALTRAEMCQIIYNTDMAAKNSG